MSKYEKFPDLIAADYFHIGQLQMDLNGRVSWITFGGEDYSQALFHRHAFGEVPRLVDTALACYCDIVGEQLQRYDGDQWIE